MFRTTVSLFVLVALLAACQATPRVYQEPPPPDARIIACPDGTEVGFQELMARLADQRVIYVGEQHNNDFHHAFQYEVVKALYQSNPNLLIGMEMFHRPFQTVLDAFIAGTISEAQMLRDTEYFSRWHFDYRYYRPILLFAREHGLPVIALNSPAEANRRVSRGGGLDGLTDEDRRWVAKEIDLTDETHRKMFNETMSGHPKMPGFNIETFYASQCLWEDTMAESAADALRDRPGSHMVVLVGGRHVENGVGIPLRAHRRGARPQTVILCHAKREPAETQAYVGAKPAHYLVLTDDAPKVPPSPKLGIIVAPISSAPRMRSRSLAPGVKVKSASKDGVAARAGVLEGDRIIGIGKMQILTLDDVKIALALLEGNEGTLTIMREYLRITLPFTLSSTLKAPTP